MKTYIVKDKTGLSGSIKEIYVHQYDSRRHILIGEASKDDRPEKDPDTPRGAWNPPKAEPDYKEFSYGEPEIVGQDYFDKKDKEDPAAKYGTHEIEFADKPGQKFTALGKDKDDMRPFNDHMAKVSDAGVKPLLPTQKDKDDYAATSAKSATDLKNLSKTMTGSKADEKEYSEKKKGATPSALTKTGGYEEPDAAKIQADADAQYKKNKASMAQPRSVKEMFSAEELAHMAAIMEANPVSPTDPEINRTARKIGNTDQVGSSINTNTVSSRDLTDEYVDEGIRPMTRTDTKYKDSPKRYSNESPKNYLKPWEKSKSQMKSEKDKAVAEYKGKVTKLPPGKAKGLKEGKDEREYGYEGDMAISQIKSIMNHSDQLMKMLKPDTDLPEWVQKKITLAGDYIQTATDYMATEMNEEIELEEGRGRPPKPGSAAYKRKHGESSSETSDDTAHQGRDPRQHIQVIAGQAAAGRHIDFKHNDGSISKITPPMGRKITSHLYGLKPAERQTAVNKMHDSADGLKV